MKTKPDPAASAPLLPGADGTVAAFGATVAETLKSMTQLTLPVPTIAQLQTDYIQQATALWNQSLQQFQAFAGSALDQSAAVAEKPVLADRRVQ